MATILISPNQLRSTAQSLIQKAKSIQTAINAVEKNINDLNSIVFAGNRASGLKAHYSRVKNELLSSSTLIQSFAKELQETAVIFDKADGIKATPTPVPSSHPIVIGPVKPIVTTPIHPYPVPPINHKLNPVDPSKYGDLGCARYASSRRPDLGSTQSDREEFTDQAAANYISKYKETAFQINSSTDLSNAIDVGYAVVWKPGIGGANATYGHVAIVEEVGSDYIVVSHAGWGKETTTRIPINKLQGLWLIP